MVSELEEELHEIKIKGIKRDVFEYIAKFNLKGQCPTQKEISKHLKISDENLKKILQRACKEGLACIHPEKIGHEYQYVLANMQDIIKVTDNKENNDDMMNNNSDTIIDSLLIQLLSNKLNPEFHHVSLETRLKYTDDYKRLCWRIHSIENKGKTFEYPISRHRKYTIMVYPNGAVMITIKATLHPFKWYSREDWIQLIEICGSIHQRIKDSLSI